MLSNNEVLLAETMSVTRKCEIEKHLKDMNILAVSSQVTLCAVFLWNILGFYIRLNLFDVLPCDGFVWCIPLAWVKPQTEKELFRQLLDLD